MKQVLEKNKAIWAIDPMVTNAQRLKNARKAIQAWQKKNGLQIMPVSILSPDDLHLPLAVMAPWGEKLQQVTQNAVKPFLKSLHLKNLADPGVIMSTAKRSSIEEFLMFAKKQKANLIVTTTHEKGSVDKNRIGRFTQKLIEKSEIPILTVRPDSEIGTEFNKLLFPTDFSPTSRKSFLKVIKIAKNLKAKIIIYHNIYEPVLPAAEFTGVAIQSSEILEDYTKNFFKLQKTRADRWIHLAKEQGVSAEYKGVRANFSLSKSILQAAKKDKVNMIVLGIESHPLMRAFLGSSVREIISHSPQPVLIINSKVARNSKNH